MATTASPEVAIKFKEILKSNGITDPVSEIVVSDTGLKGENWGGTTENVIVKFEKPNKSPLHLFVKRKLNRESELDNVFQAYERETTFFTEYLPMARKYCKGLGHENLLDIYPKCYYADDKMIILENLLLGKDFVLLKKEERQDFDAAKLASNNLAKHQAISYALIQELGGPDMFFQGFNILKYEAFVSESILKGLCANLDNGIDVMVKILESSNVDGSEKTIEKLKSKKGNLFPEISQSLATNQSNLRLLNHGDYWNNNMMFRTDKETGEIADHIMLDFGAVRYASSCVDLAYYFFTSLKSTVFRDSFYELFELYWNTLKSTMNGLGHPITITMEDIRKDFCNHFHYPFWIGLGFITQAMHEVQRELENEIKGSKDRPSVLLNINQLLDKWIKANPQRCKVDAENIIEYVNLYDRFNNGDHNNFIS